MQVARDHGCESVLTNSWQAHPQAKVRENVRIPPAPMPVSCELLEKLQRKRKERGHSMRDATSMCDGTAALYFILLLFTGTSLDSEHWTDEMFRVPTGSSFRGFFLLQNF